MVCPPTRTNVLAPLLPLLLQPPCETVLWPRRSTRMSVGLSPLLLRLRTIPETVAPSGDRLAHQCLLPVMATPMSALVFLRFPGSRHTEFLEPGTPTQNACLRHHLHATLIKQGLSIWSQGENRSEVDWCCHVFEKLPFVHVRAEAASNLSRTLQSLWGTPRFERRAWGAILQVSNDKRLLDHFGIFEEWDSRLRAP